MTMPGFRASKDGRARRRGATPALVAERVLLVVVVAVLVTVVAVGCGRTTPEADGTPRIAEEDPGAGESVPPTSERVPPSSVDPIGVGVMHLTVIDPSRATSPRGGRPAVGQRELSLTVRYPIDAAPDVGESADAVPFGQWPLIMFAHGFDASAATYAAVLHALAASGAVVVAPEFPLSSSAIDGAAIEGDEPEQARDLRFVIDSLLGAGVPAVLGAAIEPGPVGVIGHSDGAQTALLAGFAPAYRDARIGAVVAVSGRFSTFGGQWFAPGRPALLVVQASADEFNPFRFGEELVRVDGGPAALVAADGVTHLGVVTDPMVVDPVARLIADTFAWRLRGSTAARDRIAGDSLVPPLRPVASHG